MTPPAQATQRPTGPIATMRTAVALGLAVAVLALAPPVAGAQPAQRVYRLGYLSTGSAASTYMRPLEAFRQGLRELGWIEGQNLHIEYRWAEGHGERLPALAEELVRLKMDVIAANPTPAAVAARGASRTVPIVGMALTEPVAIGLVSSLARPGGNVTGVTYSVDADIFGKQLELLKEMVRKPGSVAVLLNPAGSPAYPSIIASIRAAARPLALPLHLHEVRQPGEFDGAFAAMVKQRAAALLVVGDPLFFVHRARLTDLAVRSRLPSMSTQWQWVEAGGLASYGPSLPDLWRRAATYVDKILRGARPAELPIEQPTKFELAVNGKTARALGLTITPAVLQRADEVIQ